MTTPHSLHHINFIVRDLDAAVARYQQSLGFGEPIRDELPERGVRIARYLLGETWLVLVQPTREDSVAGRHLLEHGEGVFLVSLGVDNLAASIESVRTAGAKVLDDEPRRGADGWKIQDLGAEDFFGVHLQLVETD